MQFKHIPKWILVFFFSVAGIGFADATYLTISHFSNLSVPCLVGSCELVLSSSYSVVFGIPVALFGAFYYLVVLAVLFYYIDTKHPTRKQKAFSVALCLTPIGFLASLYFFIIQAFVLHAFCQFCLVSATTSTLLFIAALHVFLKVRLPRSR
jgi:uncharacterized membrane protein